MAQAAITRSGVRAPRTLPSPAVATGAAETTRWAAARWRRSHDSRSGTASAAGPGCGGGASLRRGSTTPDALPAPRTES